MINNTNFKCNKVSRDDKVSSNLWDMLGHKRGNDLFYRGVRQPGEKVEKACLGKSCLGEILEVEEVFASWWAVGVAWKGFQAQKQHEQRLEA